MKISPKWLREFVDIKVDARQLAADLTMAGLAVESVTGEGDDAIFEMDITTNRVDAMNHYGMAREVSAICDADLRPLAAKLPPAKGEAKFQIEIAEPELCGRYTAQIIRGVNIRPSPAHVQHVLESMDARPISNAADATNYNLLEMGHPTHAFDLDLLQGGKIVVRRARPGETLRTLDGVERKLTSDDLVIADGNRAVALAGVMGGWDTMITEKTRNVLVESAWFDPATIRQMARRHGMHTDASHRFERGADFNATPVACRRVAQLILEWCGGEQDGNIIDAIGRRLERPAIQLSRAEVKRILGQEIPEQEVARILRRLGFTVTAGRASTVAVRAMPTGSGGTHAAIAEEAADFTIEIPSWRLDVEREIDLVEEIARIYGYNRFPNTLPAFSGSVVETADAQKDAALRSALLALGYSEAISVTFISETEARQFASAAPVEIENPLSEEATVMRTSLVPGMLEMIAWNLNRGASEVRLFESGNVFKFDGSRVEERKQISIAATGNVAPHNVHHGGRPYSFFDLKGDVETLLEKFGRRSMYFDGHASHHYHPGRSARAVMDGSMVACLGQLHPEITAARKLRQDVYLAEIYLDRLYRHDLRAIRYERIPRYPAVDRDFSFLFDNSVNFERIRTAVEALSLPELRRFEPAEIFRGGAVPVGEYSVLLRATFQSGERTLRDDEVARWSGQIIKALESLGGKLRA